MGPARAFISVPAGIAILVGIVVGMGIFRSPSIVAGAAGSMPTALALWALGGLVTFLGALTYAELATAYPSKGGEYDYLKRTYGRQTALLFGWSRLTIIQTGTIAGAGFVVGDYLSPFLSLGAYSSAIYAAIAVALVTLANIAGLRLSTGFQQVLAAILVLALAALCVAGFLVAPAPAAATASSSLPPLAAIGFGMIFVLLTFGGWNEAAYLSGEVRDPQRDMVRIFFFGILAVTILYLGVNWAYLNVLGLEGVAKSESVGADLAAQAFGLPGAMLVTAFVLAASFSTMNGTMFTGARSAFAVGQDFRSLSFLGGWDESRAAPLSGILAQGVIAFGLVVVGALTKQGFEAMVAYTAPVFWLFFLLSGLSNIILRLRDPQTPRPFKTPLWPLPPILFCLACGWMLYSSVSYAASQMAKGGDAFAIGVSFGLLVLLLGLALLAFEALNPKQPDQVR